MAGKEPYVSLRVPSDVVVTIDTWAARQPDKPDRAEALRRLVNKAVA